MLSHNSSEKTKVANRNILRYYLFLKLVKYKLYDDIIFEPQNLSHSLCNPRFDDFQVHFGHVHLRVEQVPIDIQLTQTMINTTRPATVCWELSCNKKRLSADNNNYHNTNLNSFTTE